MTTGIVVDDVQSIFPSIFPPPRDTQHALMPTKVQTCRKDKSLCRPLEMEVCPDMVAVGSRTEDTASRFNLPVQI